MAENSLTQLLAEPIHLADQVIKAAAESTSVKQECADLKFKAITLVNLLRQAARSSSDLYERPTKRIVEEAVRVLSRALTLAIKCRSNGLKRVFTINQSGSLRKVSSSLESCIGDVSWLLRVSAPAVDRGDLGLPPIAAGNPNLGLIWDLISVLITGSFDERADAALSLGSLVMDNANYGMLIVEEGGVMPLLKLVKDGKVEVQEIAVRTIGLLGKNAETVEMMIGGGICMAFTKVLREGNMKVQAAVAWAIAELVRTCPKCQELFGQSVIRLLVSHLAFETVEEHSKYVIVSKTPSVHSEVGSESNREEEDATSQVVHLGWSNQIPKGMHNVVSSTMAMKSENQVDTDQKNGILSIHSQQQLSSYFPSGNGTIRARESEDPATKSHMKAMAAWALCQLAKDNVHMCRCITESRALLCFAVLLEKGSVDVQYNSALALMEITAVAEKDTDLRRSAFRPNATACKAVVDQLLNIISKCNSVLLIPCIRAIGNLARTFRASETRVISPLVQLLKNGDDNIIIESATALIKFCCTDNHLHLNHSKAVLAADALEQLVILAWFESQAVRTSALVLLCYIALHVQDSEELANSQVLTVLKWVGKPERQKNTNSIHNQILEKLLPLAKSKLVVYQPRGTQGMH